MKNNLILAVIGPTASGKTSLAIELAKKLSGEIVCCDSMQIYKHMKIGTASPTNEELARASHHLFNFVEPDQNYNAALYQKAARNKIDDILSREKVPILCGGTGLYLKAALFDINFTSASSDETYRKYLEELYKNNGADFLHEMLKKVDKQSADNIHKNNIKRVIRALEIAHLSGMNKSEQKQKEKLYYENSYIIGLSHERKVLYDRINKRVDIMIGEGLEDEAHALIEMLHGRKCNALAAIGYKEWVDFFEGRISKEVCIEIIKQNSRRYAKRQLTWFNAMNVQWFEFNTSILHKYQNIIDIIKK